MKSRGWFVYIIKCGDGRLYTGMTNDLERRFREHRSGRGARFTRSFGAARIVFAKKVATRSAALRHEARIKKMTRDGKLSLIAEKDGKRQRPSRL